MPKPKILIISDTPKINSGMGVAHLEIAKGLLDTGKYEIASFGWFWWNAVARGIEWNLPWNQYNQNDYGRPYGHPEGWPNSSEEQLKNTAVYKTIEKFKPDVVLGIGDVWMLDYIKKLPNRKNFKFIWEFPIDGEPIPPSWVETIKDADVPVVMSKYAVEVIRQHDKFISIVVIHRGIDTRLFKPIKPVVGKDTIRKEVMPAAVGKFVVGMFDRFQDRKQIGRGIEAFKKFITNSKRDDAVLYLHMDVHDQASVEQGKLIFGDNGLLERHGIKDRVIYNENLRSETGVPIETLVKLYNCVDVRIAPTQGEGWGLCTVEAMACGVPNIATGYTTLPEILGDNRGLITNVKAFINGMYNVDRAVVDTDHMAAQIDALYCSPELRRFYAINGLKFVYALDWKYIIPQWDSVISSVLEKPKYRMYGNRAHYNTNSPFSEATIFGAIKEDTGWAITTRGLARGLAENGVTVSIKAGGGETAGYKLDKDIETMATAVKSHNVHIINHMPEVTAGLLKESAGRIKIAFFPFELQGLKPEVVGALNRHSDIFLTPSNFCALMATEAGVQNVGVLNIHSDIDLNAEPYNFENKKGYKFLCIGNLGDSRKNTKTLIRAFFKEFTGDDDVCLVLKSLPGHKDSDPSDIVENEQRMSDNPPDVVVIHKAVSPSELYKSCDCLVQPTRTEGFCAPVYEALHFDMPIICTAYGGHMDYLPDSEKIMAIPYKLEDAKQSPVYSLGDKWAEIDFKPLCMAMRKMYDRNVRKSVNRPILKRQWKDTGKQLVDYIQKCSSVKKIGVYFENQEFNLWNNDNRDNLQLYAPNNIQFVDNPDFADFQIVNITRLSDHKKIKCKKYIVLFHCRGEWSEEDINEYSDIFDNAAFVYSHQDLKSELKNSKATFIRGPWGTDPWKFYETPGHVPRDYKILNTGLVAKTEAIQECLAVCEALNAKQLHVGINLGFQSPSYFFATNLNAEEMRSAYHRCEYVSGLRRIEGFEKPVIEGLLCGARPVCFDTPLFRYWYDGLADFVPECSSDELVVHLKEVLSSKPKPVTESEKILAVRRFGWRNVAFNFWDVFKQRT